MWLVSWSICGVMGASSILDPKLIPKFEHELFVPSAMPCGKSSDTCHYYEIALRQLQVQMLPPSMNLNTTVWAYGSVSNTASFVTPSLPIEAKVGTCVRIKWLNQLVDAKGHFLSHLLPAVDQNLHWANPLGPVDSPAESPVLSSYEGPVPMVPHLHGAHTSEESDGHPLAWFLPAAVNLGSEYAEAGSKYAAYKAQSAHAWERGSAVYEYPNTQPASMLWFHDHTLGMTRLNVYAGAAGTYILRDEPLTNITSAPSDFSSTSPTSSPSLAFVLPAPDIPLVIQDRSFLSSGELYYPLWREETEGFEFAEDFPRYGEAACAGYPSDVKPMVVDEFFGNTILVNGRAWPRLSVSPSRYRFRVLNACNARFLQMSLHRVNHSQSETFFVIGGDGGFLPGIASMTSVLLSPAERLDVIIDFTNYTQGEQLVLRSEGPEWVPTDPLSSGLIMRFDISLPPLAVDPSTPPLELIFPSSSSSLPVLPPSLLSLPVRKVAVLPDTLSKSVRLSVNNSIASLDCYNESIPFFGPISALLGNEDANGEFIGRQFHEQITEQVEVNVLEIWEIHNLSPDNHPMHFHQTHFRVVDRLNLLNRSISSLPEGWETGLKDTVNINPDEITRLLISWERPGLSVWHCHVLEHEDNEMMRPLLVVAASPAGVQSGEPKFLLLIVSLCVAGVLFLSAFVVAVCCFLQRRKQVNPYSTRQSVSTQYNIS